MLTNTLRVHLTECTYFTGIHPFATQLNEYCPLQNQPAMDHSNPSLSAKEKAMCGVAFFLYLCPIIKTPLFMEKKTVKALFVNGGPRKNKNTALLLESAMRDEHFPIDLQNAYELGQRLVNSAQ